MIADLPVLLAGGVDPKDASPGIGAFITFLILALVIILLAWSFTRHQRRIRATAQREAEQAEHDAAERTAQESAAASSRPGQGAAEEGEARAEEPSHEPAVAADAAGSTDPDTVRDQAPPQAAVERPEDDGGASR